MNIDLTPRLILRRFCLCILFLLLANIVGVIFRLFLGHPRVYGLVPLFDFNTEANMPTFFSSLIFILCAILLWLIAVHHNSTGSSSMSWMGLAVLFVFLSVNEIAFLHELLNLRSKSNVLGQAIDFCLWVPVV